MDKILSKLTTYFEYYNEVFGDIIYLNDKIENIDLKEQNILPEISKQSNSTQNVENILIKKSTNKNIEKNINKIEPTIINLPKPSSSVDETWVNAISLEELHQKIQNCNQCPLGKTRNKLVFGSGNPNADILIIGEGPGADEDMTGLPFVGRAGQLLTKILEAIELTRDEVYIANIVKCRPPGNRRPEINEVDKCEPYLLKQIELIKPKFILALGLTAIETLFKTKFKMADIRGKLLEYHNIKTLATYHPAALLRNPNYKKGTWEDVKLLKKLYLESKEIKL